MSRLFKFASIFYLMAFNGQGVYASEFAFAVARPQMIQLVSGDGLDRDAYAQGNDRAAGMWQEATRTLKTSNQDFDHAASGPSYSGQWSLMNENVGHRAWRKPQ